eukprot:COSAG02_NODE_1999_length_10148_cov_15.105483_4_plen_439_part_00
MATLPWLLLLQLLVSLPRSTALPRRVNEFALEHAATAAIVPTGFPGSDGPALLLTTFGPVGKDRVVAVPNIRDMLSSRSVPTPVALDADAKWPNMASFVPPGTLGSGLPRTAVLEAGGFFVSPAKATGEVALLDLARLPGTPHKMKISTDKAEYFYHEAQWMDVNADGLLDVVAARAHKPVFGAAHSELAAFLQPPPGGASDSWKELVLTTGGAGPGVGFSLVDLDGDNKTQVVASQFFAAQDLSIWWCDAPHWSSCGSSVDGGVGASVAQSVVIDRDPDKAGFFAVSWVDINGDGTKDLLATTNEANGKGGVYAYEQPLGDWRTEKWTKHTLATGYKPTLPFLPGRGSPGAALAFVPAEHRQQQGEPRPSILVSADDGGFVDLLTPSAPLGWSYLKQRVVNSTGTVGTLAVADLTGKGATHFVCPLYAENKVALYSL